jgi:hypothetical protein
MIEKASSHVSVLTPARFIGRDSTTAQPGFAENQSGDLSQ